jgi:hypothetical protein
MDSKWCQNSWSITSPDFRTQPIRQISAHVTFGSLVCWRESWRESWRIRNMIQVMNFKRWLQRPELSSLLITSRASSRTGWAAWHRSSRMGENMLTNKKKLNIYVCWM